MSHPLFERHRATLDRAVQAIGERSYWSAYPESASPEELRRGRGRGWQGSLRRAARQALRADAARHRRARRHGEVAVRHRAFDHLSEVRPRRAAGRGEPRRGPVEKGGPGSVGGRMPGNHRAPESRQFRDRQRGHAHHRAGVHDGLPGGRARTRRTARSRQSPMRGTNCSACPRRRSGKSRRARTNRIRMEKHFRVVPRGVALVHRLLHVLRPGTATRECSRAWPPAMR